MAESGATALPEFIQKAVIALAELSPERFDEFRLAVLSTPVVLPVGVFATRVSRSLLLPAETVTEFITLYLTLAAWKEDSQRPTSEVLDASMRDFGPILDRSNHSSQQLQITLRERLGNLMASSAPFGVLLKAGRLQLEHPRTFMRVRLLTDVRPVFEPDVNVQPAAAVVSHQMHISVREGQQVRDMYVAMSSGDLDRLRQAINRAENKEQQLINVLHAANILAVQDVNEE